MDERANEATITEQEKAEITEELGTTNQPQRWVTVAGIVCLLVSLLIYVLRLDRVVGLFVDDAWYVLLAKSLATGHGYSLLWYEGDKDFVRIDWQHGVVCPPCNGQFHQHFNLSQEPSRYLALGIGNVRYPFTNQKRETMVGEKGKQQRSSLSIKQGGHQVEFEDQDPRIHRLWLEEMKKAGVTPRMDKYAIPA